MNYFVNSEAQRSPGTAILPLFDHAGPPARRLQDGMRLDRTPYYAAATAKELPTSGAASWPTRLAYDRDFEASARSADSERGRLTAARFCFSPPPPPIFSMEMIGRNVLGIRPKPGESVHRTAGDYASDYKSRVLPLFLSVDDDPTRSRCSVARLYWAATRPTTKACSAEKVSLDRRGQRIGELSARPWRAHPRFSGVERAWPSEFPGQATCAESSAT